MFADARRTGAELRERLSRMPPARDSREFFAVARTAHLAVSPDTGNLLYLLVRSRRARSVVEFGTSFGVSTLCLAAGLRDGAGGRVVSTEYEPEKAEAARRSLAEAKLDDLVEIRDGDALETLAGDIPAPVDFVFLDGAKELYVDVLRLLEPHYARDALVVADNAGRSPDFLSHVRDGGSYISSSFPGDVEVSLYVG